MVIVKIWGGLGNQLFQYSFGKYLSVKLGTAVKYDIQTTNSLHNFTQRDFVLSAFNVTLDTASAAEISERKFFSNLQLARIERKLAQQFPSFFKKHFVEQNIPQQPGSFVLNNNCYYEGYWQSYEYLLPVETQLRKEITLKEPLSANAAKTLAAMQQCMPVSIHVRRTDYLQHANLISCSMRYYNAAIAYTRAQFGNVQFFVFSDDIAWCRQNFIGSEFTFVEGNSNYEDLVLMSECSHQIIANSTFSWWAGWLNSNPQKKVIAPKSWHTLKDKDDSRLLPKDWLLMDV
jgi:Glycosyl transferase family 11